MVNKVMRACAIGVLLAGCPVMSTLAEEGALAPEGPVADESPLPEAPEAEEGIPSNGVPLESGPESDQEGVAEDSTNLIIVVQGSGGESPPIRGAKVFITLPDSSDMTTTSNSKGKATVQLPRGRVKIQVTARDWKTFGAFYELTTAQQEIRINLEPRNPG